jgi:mRNA interferase MazF
MKIQRGNIFLANLDPAVGSEQAGTRPVLVVQCDLANERIPTVTVVPLTSNLKAGRFLFTVLVTSVESGLAKDSVTLVFHIRTLDKSRLLRRIGTLSPDTLARVDQALLLHLGLIPAVDLAP